MMTMMTRRTILRREWWWILWFWLWWCWWWWWGKWLEGEWWVSDSDKCEGRSVACPPLSSFVPAVFYILKIQLQNTFTKYICPQLSSCISEIQMQNTFVKYILVMHVNCEYSIVPCVFHILHFRYTFMCVDIVLYPAFSHCTFPRLYVTFLL